MRIAMGVEYDGNHYHGWQTQPGLRTIQTAVEESLSTLADHPVSVSCAGRTDTGVHAMGQVIHFDTEADRNDHAWIFGGNAQLPKDISIRWIEQVGDDFDARRSAKTRRYQYLIYNDPVRPALFQTGLTWHYRYLDEKKMMEAAQYLVGEHDFSSFRAVSCQSKSSIREITQISVRRYQQVVVLDVTANAFLHHMVRNIVGTLITVGNLKEKPEWVKSVLEANDRALGGVTAPPYGLYLIEVSYPEELLPPREMRLPLFLDYL